MGGQAGKLKEARRERTRRVDPEGRDKGEGGSGVEGLMIAEKCNLVIMQLI